MPDEEMSHGDFCDTYSEKYPLIPEAALCGLWRYWRERIPPGHFLKAVLSNDLFATFHRADLESRRALNEIVKLVWNHLPASIWGDEKKYKDHLNSRRR